MTLRGVTIDGEPFTVTIGNGRYTHASGLGGFYETERSFADAVQAAICPVIPESPNSSKKSNRSRAPFWLRWFGWLLVPLALTACGGAPGAFRTTLAATAEAVKAADAQIAPAYDRQHDRCLAASADWSAYDRCMGAQPALVRAIEATDASLHTAEAALDSWDDQAEEGAAFFAFVPCLSRALSFLVEAFEAAGVELPEAIRKGLSFAAAFGGACRGDQ